MSNKISEIQKSVEALGDHGRAGAQHYERRRILPRLATVPEEWLDREGQIDVDVLVIEKLSQLLCSEAQRGNIGHWSYSADRHMALIQALRAELQAYEHRHMAPMFGAIDTDHG